MLKGKTKTKDWRELKTRKFCFAEDMSDAECGAYALHTLTKRPYKEILKLSKKGHWPNKVMFDFLKKHGYEIHPVTLGNIVDCYTSPYKKFSKTITMDNVLLVDQRALSGENTWAVIYHNIQAHSGEVSPQNPIEFANYPIQAIYCIWHKKWK